MSNALMQSHLPGLEEPKRGKVRDIYDLGSELLIVACDRISAYDHVLRPAIPGKGKILTQMSTFWFDSLTHLAPNHLVATDVRDFPALLAPHRDQLRGRSVIVRKAHVVPFECVARGYLAGSGFREYRESGGVCGIPLPAGLERASRLPAAIFTPATKAAEGHDENVDFSRLERDLGSELASQLATLTIALYEAGTARARRAGLLLADTKFEFGMCDGELLLIDEVLTPDSSRYWESESWTPGVEPVSYDKQYVRNWLDESGWDHDSPPPALPAEVVDGTLARYREAFRRITGEEPVI